MLRMCDIACSNLPSVTHPAHPPPVSCPAVHREQGIRVRAGYLRACAHHHAQQEVHLAQGRPAREGPRHKVYGRLCLACVLWIVPCASCRMVAPTHHLLNWFPKNVHNARNRSLTTSPLFVPLQCAESRCSNCSRRLCGTARRRKCCGSWAPSSNGWRYVAVCLFACSE